MSYTVLARRYRSGTFDEVVGQEHVAQTLKRAIESGRVAHAYLFCGTRGVGKTSMARILAKALNCQSFDKPTTEPCGKCTSCLAIARGDDIDVLEIDAASNTQVDKTREVVIDNVNYSPAHSRYKIFIIDEVHMLSKSSFNALLKTLEEPPGHVKFILATTETEKIPNTILSRCQRYDFRNIPTREIAAHLREVSRGEKIDADDEALMLIAKAGAGSMRDALSLLERLLSIGETKLTVEMVEGLLGLPRTQLIFDLMQAIADGDTKRVLTQSNAIVNAGQSADALVSSLVDHLRNLLIIKTCGIESELVEVPGLSRKQLTAQAGQFDAMALSQDIALLEELRRQMRYSTAARALLDATLVRLALADQLVSVAELLSEAGGGASPAPRASRPTASASTQKKNDIVTQSAQEAPTTATAGSPISAAASAGSDEDDDDLPRPGKVWENDGPSLSELLKQRQTASQSETALDGSAEFSVATADDAATDVTPPTNGNNIETVDPDDLPAVWQALMKQLSEKGPGLLSILSHGKYVGIIEGRATIRYARQHETFVKRFERNGKKEAVRQALSAVLQQSVGVAFDVDPETADAPASAPAPRPVAAAAAAAPVMRQVEAPVAPAPARPTAEQIAMLRESDPLIRALIDDLGAQVIKIE